MAVLIHAHLASFTEESLTYQFASPPNQPANVTIPRNDPDRYVLDDEEFAFLGQRVVARASSTFKKTGEWPEGFTIAS